MLAYQNRVFTVESDFQVGETMLDYASIGIGAPFALGALYSMDERWPTKDKIAVALNAAQHFTGHVREPFHMEFLPYTVEFELDF